MTMSIGLSTVGRRFGRREAAPDKEIPGLIDRSKLSSLCNDRLLAAAQEFAA